MRLKHCSHGNLITCWTEKTLRLFDFKELSRKLEGLRPGTQSPVANGLMREKADTLPHFTTSSFSLSTRREQKLLVKR